MIYRINLIIFFFLLSCFSDMDDSIMYYIYQKYHQQILYAVDGTEIPASYLAALISLESYPLGDWDSERFEIKIYNRLIDLKYRGIAFGNVPRDKIIKLNDNEIKQLATSYGLTQIMGYHCLSLGCSIDDLRGSDHLLWSVDFIRKNYLQYIKSNKWEECFRIHNSGRPTGKTFNKNYAEKGIKRMKLYEKWIKKKGKLFEVGSK